MFINGCTYICLPNRPGSPVPTAPCPRLLAGPLPDDLALLVEYRRDKKRVLHGVCRLWAAAGD